MEGNSWLPFCNSQSELFLCSSNKPARLQIREETQIELRRTTRKVFNELTSVYKWEGRRNYYDAFQCLPIRVNNQRKRKGRSICGYREGTVFGLIWFTMTDGLRWSLWSGWLMEWNEKQTDEFTRSIGVKRERNRRIAVKWEMRETSDRNSSRKTAKLASTHGRFTE